MKIKLFRSFSIKNKLITILFLTSSTVLFFTSIAFVVNDFFETYLMKAHELSTLARFIGTHSVAALDFNDKNAADKSLAALSGIPHISYGCIYDDKDKIFASYIRKDFSVSSIPSCSIKKEGLIFKNRYLMITYRITLDEEIIGSVFLVCSLEDMIVHLYRYAGIVSVIMFVMFVIALMLAKSLQKVISDPILKLAETAGLISQSKDYSIRAAKTDNEDEIGVLINGINEMLSEIQKRDNELAVCQYHLEKQVADRTSELKYSRDFLQLLMDTIPAPIFYKTKEGIYTGCNKAFEEWAEKNKNQIVGKDDYNIWTKKDAALIRKFDMELIETFGSQAQELRILLPDSSYKNVIIYKAIYYIQNTNKYGIVGVFLDITAMIKIQESLKIAKEEAEAANKAKSEFLANMSHEIRTPLNAVIGFSDMLYSMIIDEKHRGYIESIKSSGKNLLNLINDILDLSKIEAGRMEIKNEPVNPNSLFKEIKNIFATKISEKDLEFIIDIAPNIPACLILDEVRLRQILFNLIGNAVKFTDTGYIKLSVQSIYTADDQSTLNLIISVEDTGIGIKPEALEYIFDAFKQQDGQSTKKYGGTGLGLSITRRLVEMMGGKISVTSERNKGTKFEFVLNDVSVSSVPAKNDRKEEFDEENIIFEKAVILVVDDIETNRHLIKEYFQDTNVSILEAGNGEESVKQAKKYKPDLILMDIRMPVMDGYEATKIIKNDASIKNIVIIALTASGMQADKEKVMSEGFDGFLTKPVQQVDLFMELARFMKYTKKQIITDKRSEDVENKKVDKLDINKLKELRYVLEKDFMNEWSNARQKQCIPDIETFANKIKDIGNKYNFQEISQFGDNLLVSVNMFDIEGMCKILDSFPLIVAKIGN
ncbi:MAG: response regulator [Desulfobacterales bacterium]|nr:response regulator [Desulfobacterales bacterium]